jgi:hypothetical protein
MCSSGTAAAGQTPGLQIVIGDAMVIGLEGRDRVNENDDSQKASTNVAGYHFGSLPDAFAGSS